jgi:hypothetical protein
MMNGKSNAMLAHINDRAYGCCESTATPCKSKQVKGKNMMKPFPPKKQYIFYTQKAFDLVQETENSLDFTAEKFKIINAFKSFIEILERNL